MIEIADYKDMIEAAIAYNGGTHTYQDVVDAILVGKMQLWPAPDACAVTEIVSYPQTKHCHIFLAAGNLDTILDGQDSVIAWAKAQGCSRITLSGRMGWSKVLKNRGWETPMLTMIKEI